MISLNGLIHHLQNATEGSAELDQLVVDYLTPGKRMVGRSRHYTRSLDAKLPGEEIIRASRLKRNQGWRATLNNNWTGEGATEILARRIAVLTYRQFVQSGLARERRTIVRLDANPTRLPERIDQAVTERKGPDRRRQDDQLIISMLCDELRRARSDHEEPAPLQAVHNSSIQLRVKSNTIHASSEQGRLATQKFSEVFDAWCVEHRPVVTHIERVRVSVSRFIDLLGDLAMNDYTKDQVRRYVREVRRVPRILPRPLRGKPIQALVRYGAENPGVGLLAPTTVRSHLKDVQMLFNWAVATDQCAASPAANLKVVDHRKQSDLRVCFDEADLKIIFERSPLYSGCLAVNRRKQPGDLIIKDALFWFPLFGLFSGARLGEIADARLEDFKCEDGIHFLDIHAAGDAKPLKTHTADRLVPVHPELIRIGFLDYLEEQRESGQTKAFFTVEGQRDIGQRSGWSAAWRLFSDSVSIYDKRKVFHSFRHTFKRACRDSGLDEEIHDALTGHRPYYSGRRYGKGIALSTLQQAMSKVRFGGLDLSHLYSGPIIGLSREAVQITLLTTTETATGFAPMSGTRTRSTR